VVLFKIQKLSPYQSGYDEIIKKKKKKKQIVANITQEHCQQGGCVVTGSWGIHFHSTISLFPFLLLCSPQSCKVTLTLKMCIPLFGVCWSRRKEKWIFLHPSFPHDSNSRIISCYLCKNIALKPKNIGHDIVPYKFY
jgi:hypothetical protein